MTHRRAQLHDRGHAEDLRVATAAGPQSSGHTTGVGDDGQPGYGVLPMPGPKRPSLGRGSTGLPPSSCAPTPRRSSAGAHDRRAPPGPRPSRGPAAPQADRRWSVVPDGQVGGQDLGQVTPLARKMVVDVGGDGDVVAPIHRDVVRHGRGVRPDDRDPLFLAPFSQRSMSTTAWAIINFGMPAPCGRRVSTA